MPLNTTFSYFGKLLVFTLLPYAVPYIALQYFVPIILTTLGFGLKGILIGSIASWIQSKYGTPHLFSLLQSIGARGGNLYPKFWSGIIGTYKLIESYTKRLSSRVSTSTLKGNQPKQTHTGYSIYRMGLAVVIFVTITFKIITWCLKRKSPFKVTDILPRNPSGGYGCPQCKKEFKPQGITNHVKSCAKEWCKKNGIFTNKN